MLLIIGGGGGGWGEGYYVWGEGHNILSTDLGGLQFLGSIVFFWGGGITIFQAL